MKLEVAKSKVTRLINSGMVVLVSANFQQEYTVTTCAWYQVVCKDPPTVSVALSKKHFSSELINKSKKYIINIPTWSILDSVVKCGAISGRDADKYKEAGLTYSYGHVLKDVRVVDECIGHLECDVIDVKEVGDHYLFFGEIKYAQALSTLFINDFWDTNRVNLVFHLGGKYFFKSSAYFENNMPQP